jgi:hypothetical protein
VVLHQADALPWDGRIAEVWPFYWDTAAISAACAPS